MSQDTSENQPWNRIQISTFVLVLLVFFVDGIDIQILPVLLPQIASDWQLLPATLSTAVAAGFAGSAIGAAIGGILGDRLGRKPVIIGSLILLGIMTVAIAWAPNLDWLIAIRFLAGIGMGSCVPPALALLSETVPERHRSISISMALVSTPLGVSAAGLLTALSLETYSWQKLMALCGSLPIIVAIMILIAMPSSHDQGSSTTESTAKGLQAFLKQASPMRLAALSGCFFMVYCAMTTALGWLTTLFIQQGFSQEIASLMPSIWSTSGIIGTCCIGWFIRVYGTSTTAQLTLLLGITGSAMLSMSDVAHEGFDFYLIFIFVATIGFSLSAIIATLYTRTAEVFPSSIKATSIGIIATAGRIGAILGAYTGGFAIHQDSFGGFFLLVCLLLLLGLGLFQIDRWQSRVKSHLLYLH